VGPLQETDKLSIKKKLLMQARLFTPSREHRNSDFYPIHPVLPDGPLPAPIELREVEVVATMV